LVLVVLVLVLVLVAMQCLSPESSSVMTWT